MKTFLKVVLVIWILGSTGYYLCKINHHCSKAPISKATSGIAETPSHQSKPVQEVTEEVISKDTISAELNRIENSMAQSPYFYFNSNSTEPGSIGEIDILAKDLSYYLSQKKNSMIQLTGHTDFTGNNALNYQLGLKRATALKRILVREGIDSSRISIDSKGEENPVADNKTKEGRKKNRRVEIHIIH
jgi:outer membrane protein OmpA-like peptidoglycan-associated protein